MTAKDIIGKITDEKNIKVQLVEENEVIMPEIFISIKANALAKEVADEILSSLDKRVYKDLAVKTRLDEYSRNYYKQLDKDTDVLVMLPKQDGSTVKNKAKIKEAVEETIQEKSTEELINSTKQDAQIIPVSEQEKAQAGRDSKKITVDNTAVINTGSPTSNPSPSRNTTNANNNVPKRGDNA